MTYLINLPNVILVIEIGMFDLISPKQMVMALPNIGTKAKKPIHAPWPPIAYGGIYCKLYWLKSGCKQGCKYSFAAERKEAACQECCHEHAPVAIFYQ